MDYRYLFTSLNGRINRQPYWQGVIVLFLVSIALSVAATMVIVGASSGAGVVVIAPLILIGFLTFAASTPLVVKRLHDRSKSGHYAWLFYGATVGSRFTDSVARTYSESAALLLVDIVLLAIWLWFFVELGFFRGAAGPNAFGSDPLATTN